MKDPKIISIVKHQAVYDIPTYIVENGLIADGMGETIHFCKGSTSDSNIFRQEGVFVESLIQLAIVHLDSVNVGELESEETKIAIMKLQESLMWLNKRVDDRKRRAVQGTYNK